MSDRRFRKRGTFPARHSARPVCASMKHAGRADATDARNAARTTGGRHLDGHRPDALGSPGATDGTAL